MNKKSRFYIALLLLITLSIGTSFAYFLIGIRYEGNSGTSSGKAESNFIKVEYDAGSSAINASGIIPGESKTKDFSITITPTTKTKTVTYAIKIDIANNTFVKCNEDTWVSFENECIYDADELVYTLKDGSNNVISSGYLESKLSSEILINETKTVTDTTTFDYKFTIEFKDTDADQNHNRSKIFSGDIVVEFAE